MTEASDSRKSWPAWRQRHGDAEQSR